MDKTKQIEQLRKFVDKLNAQEGRFLFYVPDTKGRPSGWMTYIYMMAKAIADSGRKVVMLTNTAKADFVGVGEWLGEDYAKLEHVNVNEGNFTINLTDFVFVPDNGTHIMDKLNEMRAPCKRIAIIQNIDELCNSIGLGMQIGDFGFTDVITNSDLNASFIKSCFPYANITVIQPELMPCFFNTGEPKKLIVTIVSSDQKYVEQIVKPFFWKHPELTWVSFRAVADIPKELFASTLRESAITIWCDDDTRFGYTPLEAMQCGSLVLAKIPNEPLGWINNDGSNVNCAYWFSNVEMCHGLLEKIIRDYITDGVQPEVYDMMKNTVSPYVDNDLSGRCAKYAEGLEEVRKKQITNEIERLSK